jgi:hypothetical protein
MTPLGNALVFYLKYMTEMLHLRDPESYGGEPDLTGLDNPEQVRERVAIVGDAACEQAAAFLEVSGREIEAHFTGLQIASLSSRRTRAFLKKRWSWQAQVHLSSVPGGSFWCGAWLTAPPEVRRPLEKDSCGVVVPWLASKGGRKGEEAVCEVLGGRVHSRSGEGVVQDSGTVALGCIPIKPEPPESFDVDRDPLIADVVKAFAQIGAREATAIAKFAAGLNEPEEA